MHNCFLRSRCKREEIIESYIVELENIDPSIDYRRLLDELYQKMEKEDTEDLEMQLMIYPYLLSEIRKKEEREYKDGEKDN